MTLQKVSALMSAVQSDIPMAIFTSSWMSEMFVKPSRFKSHGEKMVSVKVFVPVPPALVALKFTAETPLVLGVPEIKPVAVLIDSLAGNPVALKLVGLLVAEIW